MRLIGPPRASRRTRMRRSVDVQSIHVAHNTCYQASTPATAIRRAALHVHMHIKLSFDGFQREWSQQEFLSPRHHDA